MHQTYVLTTAFSVNMLLPVLQQGHSVRLQFMPLREAAVKAMLSNTIDYTVKSAVGHEATAQVLSQRLAANIAFNRENVVFPQPGINGLIIAQLPRPQEGQIYTAEQIAAMPIHFVEIYAIGWDED